MLNNLIWTNLTDSTSDLVKNYSDYSCVVAKAQSKARGRQGRKWESFEDSLMFSFKLPVPKRFPLGFLSVIAGIALHKAILENSKKNFFLKWPNDILDEKGKKAAGILIESNSNSCIIGIGLNYGQQQSSDFAFLESKSDKLWILKRFFLLLNKELIKSQKEVLEYWYQHSLYKPDAEVEIKHENSQLENGTIKEIALDGSLILINEIGNEMKITNIDAVKLKVNF